MVSVLAFIRVDQREPIDWLQEAQYPFIPPPQLCSEETTPVASRSFLHYLFHFLPPLLAASQSRLFQEPLDLLNFPFPSDAISAIRNEASAEYNERPIRDVSKAVICVCVITRLLLVSLTSTFSGHRSRKNSKRRRNGALLKRNWV